MVKNLSFKMQDIPKSFLQKFLKYKTKVHNLNIFNKVLKLNMMCLENHRMGCVSPKKNNTLDLGHFKEKVVV